MNRAGRRRSREVLLVRIGLGERIELQPGEEEARDEGVSTIVGEHALHLMFERSAIAQTIVLRRLQERRIGRVIPEHAREARRDLAAVGGGARRFVCAPSARSMASEGCVGRCAIRSGSTGWWHRACLKLAIGSRPQRRVLAIRVISAVRAGVPDAERERPL